MILHLGQTRAVAESGVGFLGIGAATPFPPATWSGGALWAPHPWPHKGIPLFSALRMASPVTIILWTIMQPLGESPRPPCPPPLRSPLAYSCQMWQKRFCYVFGHLPNRVNILCVSIYRYLVQTWCAWFSLSDGCYRISSSSSSSDCVSTDCPLIDTTNVYVAVAHTHMHRHTHTQCTLLLAAGRQSQMCQSAVRWYLITLQYLGVQQIMIMHWKLLLTE